MAGRREVLGMRSTLLMGEGLPDNSACNAITLKLYTISKVTFIVSWK